MLVNCNLFANNKATTAYRTARQLSVIFLSHCRERGFFEFLYTLCVGFLADRTG